MGWRKYSMDLGTSSEMASVWGRSQQFEVEGIYIYLSCLGIAVRYSTKA